MAYESDLRPALIHGDKTLHQITEDVCRPIESKPNKYWWAAFILSASLALWWVVCVSYTIGTGIGVWGLNRTVGWAWDITNFVWWIGIGHAGTLISAILLLFRQKWRLSINRSAEAMTIFAVICAATFIVSHMGRPWL
ncbi:MAG: hydrogenase, partial [Bacteroidia bacterium]|nr:hydrogenase [Bacteroidia bacterium]